MDNINFLVTSREQQHIRQSLVDFRHIRIEDEVSRVDQDIAKYIDYKLQMDPNLQWLDMNIKDHISNRASSKSMTLLETFSKLRTIKAIRQSLNQLPQDLHETYDRILARVSRADLESARRILLWVSFAVTPLTLEEIRTAIAIESSIDHLDEESLLRSPHDILDLVGGLVNVTSQGHVTLAHMSVKDYLLSTRIRDSQVTSYFALSADDSSSTLFQCCMTYISFADFKEGPAISSDSYLQRLRKFPLLRHAAISWPYYYRAATPSDNLTAAAMQFFDNENRKLFMSWVQTINADNPFSWDFYPRHATALYYAATFGLTNIVGGFIKANVELDLPGSRYGGTALHGAVYRLHVPVVQLLLDAGADVNKADFLNVSPLHTAATLGNIGLIESLLRFSANIKAVDDMGESPLDWALKAGQAETLSASSDTIRYFPEFHRRRSGMESSIVLKVEIGTDVLTEQELPNFSPWILEPEGRPTPNIGCAKLEPGVEKDAGSHGASECIIDGWTCL
ncbi:hypothetical protein M434DRAFT_22639 [Hypoxylon sp. CO27-5]|nr:hypothetical protein M434DRAFT_22639 [Hypoxylon sp. CO27-5]